MIIGIYDGACVNVQFDETTPFLGGSETWLVEISSAFSDLGHEVYLFVNTPTEHDYKNVHYIKKEHFEDVCSKVEFDNFIYSRGVIGKDKVKTKSISLMLHDMGIHFNRGEHFELSDFKHIYVLSDWHKMLIHTLYNIPVSDFIKKTINGVNLDLYKDVDKSKKENTMIWSSCFERGLEFFLQYVYPKIKALVPDFTLKICSYNTYRVNAPGVVNLGRLTKSQLAEEQKKAKIWCYPNIGISSHQHLPFKETFCITAVENAAAGNCILTTKLGGMGTTCKGVQFLSSDFYNDQELIDHPETYGNYLADECVKALKSEFFTTFDHTKFTWENAAKSLLE